MSGIGRVVEKTCKAHSIAQATIAEETIASAQMESNVALLAVQAKATTARVVSALYDCMRESVVDIEAKMSRIVGMMAQQLEREIEVVAISTTTMSKQKTRSAVDGLCAEIQTHLSQNRADFERRQEEMAQKIAKVSTDLELLTEQLNHFKPASGSDVGNVQEKLT